VRRYSYKDKLNGFWYKAEDSRLWADAHDWDGIPPPHVRHKLGFFSGGPLNIGVYTRYNDDHGYSFKRIAQELRRDYAAAGLDLSA
jgi:hypothetical protein